jgi:hypothetical protein
MVAIVSEPGAVATGSRTNFGSGRLFRIDRIGRGAGRFHHPTRAARVGTPVRSRF